MSVSLEGIDAFDNIVDRLLAAERKETRDQIHYSSERADLQQKIRELECLAANLHTRIAELEVQIKGGTI